MKLFKKDIIILGVIAGLIGNSAKLILAFILNNLGLMTKTYLDIAGNYFQHDSLDNIYGIINSLLADFFYGGFLGVVLYILIRNTDMNYIKLKGLLFGGLLHVVHNGIFVFGEFNPTTLDDLNQFMLLFPTLLYGLVTAWTLEILVK
ncbi:hypothetical protein [Natranaerobius thermophilus]|uniref:Uncharacterized protein n=1 Tax=Natranaerobius thermophilus (strain ATCC BAA-1301 / DSM 18059 / JW/NM-WN-LF) TaxID=457570 RepID=B2A2C3_NATTJ|nr:hypothetical protein [Natranaerobius thermophilus]ACB86229.1 hypothetical protein Nther_2674 [Natranaerobius thermophilus JW/NM-WN-LF]